MHAFDLSSRPTHSCSYSEIMRCFVQLGYRAEGTLMCINEQHPWCCNYNSRLQNTVEQQVMLRQMAHELTVMFYVSAVQINLPFSFSDAYFTTMDAMVQVRRSLYHL